MRDFSRNHRDLTIAKLSCSAAGMGFDKEAAKKTAGEIKDVQPSDSSNKNCWILVRLPSGKPFQKTMERSTMLLMGKSTNYINYFDWAIFNSFLYVYQRVFQSARRPPSLPKEIGNEIGKTWESKLGLGRSRVFQLKAADLHSFSNGKKLAFRCFSLRLYQYRNQLMNIQMWIRNRYDSWLIYIYIYQPILYLEGVFRGIFWGIDLEFLTGNPHNVLTAQDARCQIHRDPECWGRHHAEEDAGFATVYTPKHCHRKVGKMLKNAMINTNINHWKKGG